MIQIVETLVIFIGSVTALAIGITKLIEIYRDYRRQKSNSN
jgi:hypothetical protein